MGNVVEEQEESKKAIEQALSVLLEPGTVAELRVPKTKKGIVSGYFDDPNKLLAEARKLDGKAPGIYVTLNPVIPVLLARANNRIKEYVLRDDCANQNDIVKRRWFPIDLDPERPKGISSTDEEHQAALQRAQDVKAYLSKQGWPAPVEIDSGNGAHLLYRIDLPNDLEGRKLVEQCIKALAAHFSDDKVNVDTSVVDASRIWKLPGTMACKGENMQDRPHRRANLLHVPASMEVVAREELEKVATVTSEEELKPVIQSKMAKAEREESPTAGSITETQRHNKLIGVAGALRNRGFDGPAIKGALSELNDKGMAEPLGQEEVDGIAQWAQKKDAGEEQEHLTDLGNAHRFVALHGGKIRYCQAFGKWLLWNGKHWQVDETGRVMRLAKETVQRMFAEAGTLQDEDKRRSLAGHALKTETKHRLDAMVALAQTEPGIPVTPNELDADPWLLNVQNGTIDLKTGELRPHNPEDLITKLAPVEYDCEATCPTWLAFLDHIMAGNEDLIAFLQRAVGYSLTADTREQVLFILHGTGANGKSTFVNTLGDMLGDFAMNTPTQTLMVKQAGGIPNDVARLRGARFVTAVEAEDGKRLAESLVKQMTGGDKITARFLHKEFFDFVPSYKVFLATNHKPNIRGTDHAIWRRIRLVPFDVTIPDAEQDHELSSKLRKERAGIIRWAIEGCLSWQKDGLGNPKEIRAATNTYREEMDKLAHFLAECCVMGQGAKVLASELYREYVNWCDSNGEFKEHQREFAKKLKERGLASDKGTGGYYMWRGIRLYPKPNVSGASGASGVKNTISHTKENVA